MKENSTYHKDTNGIVWRGGCDLGWYCKYLHEKIEGGTDCQN